MAKKCIPGVICIENMTLFVLVLIFLLLGYMYLQYMTNLHKQERNGTTTSQMFVTPRETTNTVLMPVATRMPMRPDPFSDPYAPPLKTDGYYFRTDTADIRGVPPVPVSMPPRGFATSYDQVGILTRSNSREPLILPLMGRRAASSSNKWQYYTISNSGNINTKLPVSYNGRSCTKDVGCDEINNNDTVYVEGYKDTFVATVYETGTFSYNPYI